MVVTRCFRYCRFNQSLRNCRGTETCPLGADNHNLRNIKRSQRITNALTAGRTTTIAETQKKNENHSSLDMNCPSMKGIIEKYKKNQNTYTKEPHNQTMDDTIIQLKCVLFNLQHATGATANLMKYAADNKVDITCIQEP